MRRTAFLLALCALTTLGVIPAARAQPVAPPSGQAELNTELRIGELEDRIRELTGRIEELTNSLNQTKQQLDRLSSDVDVRFNQLQQPAAVPGVTAPVPPPPLRPPQGAGDLSQPPSRSGSLGVLTAPGPGAAPPPAAPPPAPPQTASADGTLPAGSVQDQYNYAMGLLTQANYPAAEQAMRNFVQRWPKDPLAGNAQYWLGETFYVRKDYANAATAFAQGYEKYPKSAKAADDLLKLGMSLSNLNQKADACRAFARLQRDFPTVSPPIKERLAGEKQRAGC